MIFPHRYYLKIKQRQTWRRAFSLYRDPDWREYYRDMRIWKITYGEDQLTAIFEAVKK